MKAMKKEKLFTRNFTLLILGQVSSLTGNYTLKFALSMYVLEQTGSASIFAGMLSAALLPTVLLSPFGGILADRANRKHIMVALDALSGLSVLAAGLLLPLIRRYAAAKPILGICLGEQAIGEAFGARLENLAEVHHGVCSDIRVVAGDPLFDGLGTGFRAGRYHSWVVSAEGLPDCLEVTATDRSGLIMGLRHKTYNLRGIQFHPESVLTPQGKTILENWITKCNR